jgi:hypothetical protein
LSFGINPFDFSVKLPMLGRLGPARVFEALPAPAPAATPEGTGSPLSR